MITPVPFDSLGRFDNDWLKARYHFSFAGYHDPARQGHGPLLVWNDDTIAPGRGFDLHGHRDMEIITYVREGAVTHHDHLGNEGRTVAGDLQVMSAGRGILHAEYNLEAGPTTLFQIWILPERTGLPPRWEQRSFPRGDCSGQLVPLASGRDGDILAGALMIHQDATLYGATLAAGETLEHALADGRRAYLVVARGAATVNGTPLGPRDGARIEAETRLTITATEETEILLADLP